MKMKLQSTKAWTPTILLLIKPWKGKKKIRRRPVDEATGWKDLPPH
jgi:hypothetical protein